MAKTDDKCPKCQGALVYSSGVKTCINCGDTPMSAGERQQWWRDNRKEIARDAVTIGVPATIAKWRIPKQLIATLHRGSPALLSKAAPAADPQGPEVHIPDLPDFKDSWTTEVQLKWFDIWTHFATKE